MPKKLANSPQVDMLESHHIGMRTQPDQTTPFSEIYRYPHGSLYQGDSIEWLKSLDSESVDLVFADPPYNINKADWDKFESQEKYIDWSMQWIKESYRVLKKQVLYIFVDSQKFLQILNTHL